jgi:hypothetical protein
MYGFSNIVRYFMALSDCHFGIAQHIKIYEMVEPNLTDVAFMSSGNARYGVSNLSNLFCNRWIWCSIDQLVYGWFKK